jgi:hypothetical protein
VLYSGSQECLGSLASWVQILLDSPEADLELLFGAEAVASQRELHDHLREFIRSMGREYHLHFEHKILRVDLFEV